MKMMDAKGLSLQEKQLAFYGNSIPVASNEYDTNDIFGSKSNRKTSFKL